MLSKTLFKAIDNGVFIEIVIVSESNNKSMKLVNLCKRLIDQEVSIYWKLDEKLFAKIFAIFDKQYLISSRPKQAYEIQKIFCAQKMTYSMVWYKILKKSIFYRILKLSSAL